MESLERYLNSFGTMADLGSIQVKANATLDVEIFVASV